MAIEQVRAVLEAYLRVAGHSWPELHPAMAQRSARWPTAAEPVLSAELADYLRETQGSEVRVFWKLGPQFAFAGANDAFARDAGFAAAAEVVGLDDFDPRLPWRHQAAKYRADDKRVYASGEATLDAVERHEAPDGSVVWVRVSKAPVTVDGQTVGIFGMYQIVDGETGRRLFAEQLKRDAAKRA
jgi:PAS domain-containing protein